MFNRLRFRHLFAKIVYAFRLAPVFWRHNNNFISILNYHYLSNEPEKGDVLEVSFQTIEQPIRTLKDEYSLLPCVSGLDSLFMQQGGELSGSEGNKTYFFWRAFLQINQYLPLFLPTDFDKEPKVV